jgi:signal transduction histidine kinase
MIRTLWGKLSLILVLHFVVSSAVVIFCVWMLIDEEEVRRLVMQLMAIVFVCALAVAVIAFRLSTRRLQRLVDAVDDFRQSNFDGTLRITGGDAKGDEVGRLTHAFQEMSRRIVDQLRLLKDTDTRRRELLANVSHDLRTPLATMRGYLETLMLKEGSLTHEEQRNYLEVAARQAERLGKLIADLFELTKLEAREVTLNAEPFSLTELTQDIVQKFDLAATKRGIRVEADVADAVANVYADISLIERVLDNLIDNALRHTMGGGLVRVTLKPMGDRTLLKVSDTGSGIAPQDLANVFDRFYQGDRNMGNVGGAGLGLAIAKRVIALHGSDIKVESELGVGTSFSFELPLANDRQSV